MPRNAPRLKVESTAALGAEIVIVGPASAERMQKAEELARQHGYVIVPPYNDEQIIAGQGTIGLEILEDCPEVDLVLVPAGGGGLISGISAAIKLSGSQAKSLASSQNWPTTHSRAFARARSSRCPRSASPARWLTACARSRSAPSILHTSGNSSTTL